VIRSIYRNLEEILGCFLLTATGLVATIQVASRYVLSRPFSWTEELATCLFVYLAFVGAALALKKKEHFALETLVERLPDRLKRGVCLLSSILILACSAIVFWFGCRLTAQGWNVTTPALEIPSSIPYAAVPLGGLLMTLRAFESLIEQWRTPHPRNEKELSNR
jgi:TRAP-type C4-dicarboxylate transport system permease small subunit